MHYNICLKQNILLSLIFNEKRLNRLRACDMRQACLTARPSFEYLGSVTALVLM